MAHPYRKEGVTGHNEKLRRMTMHYGEADPAMNQKAPTNKYKIEGPEEHVGFGADADKATARSDRPARRSTSANPVATYRRGGAVKEAVPAKAHGGRLSGKHKGGKGSTHVNVIVAPHPGNSAGMQPPPNLAALAAPKPPMGGPPMPPPGAPPMGAGAMPPGPMMPPQGPNPMMRKRGGRVHEDAAEDKKLIKKTLSEEGLIKKARGGGVDGLHMRGGSLSGEGRLDKIHHYEKHGNKRKQEV